MINEIKQYKELIEVNVTDFNGNMEVLYWEWDIETFAGKYQTLKAISFPIHWWKIIDVNRIQWFEVAKPENKNLQNMIASFDSMQQENIILKVKEYKKTYKKYPTDTRIKNVIDAIVYPYKAEEAEIRKQEESDRIRKLKQKRLDIYNSLDSKQKDQLINDCWNKVELIKPWCNRDNVYDKAIFLVVKNEYIDKYYLNK